MTKSGFGLLFTSELLFKLHYLLDEGPWQTLNFMSLSVLSFFFLKNFWNRVEEKDR